MKTETILLVGALAVGGFFLVRALTGATTTAAKPRTSSGSSGFDFSLGFSKA